MNEVYQTALNKLFLYLPTSKYFHNPQGLRKTVSLVNSQQKNKWGQKTTGVGIKKAEGKYGMGSKTQFFAFCSVHAQISKAVIWLVIWHWGQKLEW